jgi:hypothetical protein
MIDAMQVRRQGRVLVRDLDWLDERIEEFGARLVAFNRLSIRAYMPRIMWIAVQKEFRYPVIGSSTLKVVPRTDAMAASKLVGRLTSNPLGDAILLFIPTVDVAGLDAADSDQDFAEFARAVGRCTKGTLRFIPELGIVRKQWWLAFGFSFRLRHPRRLRDNI